MVVRTRITAAALAVALTAGLLACGGGDDNDETTSDTTEAGHETTTTAAEESTTTLPPEEEVWNAWTTGLATVGAATNPNDPVLTQLLTGVALSETIGTKTDNQAGHRRPQSTTQHNRQSVVVTGDSATVEDCAIDTTTVYSTDTGAPLGPQEVYSAAVTAKLQKVGETWKIAEITFTPQECPAT